MPGFDGTGPRGEGPMTGGARGYCNPGYTGYGRGYGPRWGRGFRGGFGWGRPPYPPAGSWYGPGYGAPYGTSREDELGMLKKRADMLKTDLDAIHKRIEELDSESSQS